MSDGASSSTTIPARPPWRVARIGARGDGVAETPDGPAHIPFAAPGDLVDPKASPAIVAPAGARVEPVCPHFTDCGGCALQHLPATVLAAEKRGWLADALTRRGFDAAAVAALRAVPSGTRRRARLAYLRTARGVVLGFNARRDKRIVDIEDCAVLHPDLRALLSPLRRLIAAIGALGKAGDAQLTHADTGVELVFFAKRPAEPDYADREALVAFAAERGLARIGWGDGAGSEPIAAPRAVRVLFGDTPVEIPPAAFLQPSREGEALIRTAVLAALPQLPARLAIADLDAGCGGIGLVLAQRGHKVLAVDGAAASIAALRKAAGPLPIQAEIRDLVRKPLSAKELARFDVAVFDPPRAGAARQAEALAESAVETVIAVSCNPATLARDLGILAAGGYRLRRAVPIDQFPWAAHLEAVCVMTR